MAGPLTEEELREIESLTGDGGGLTPDELAEIESLEAPKPEPNNGWIEPSALQRSRMAQTAVQRALREGINQNDVTKFVQSLNAFEPEHRENVIARAKLPLQRFKQLQAAQAKGMGREAFLKTKFSDLWSEDPVKRSQAFLEQPGEVGRTVTYPLKGFLDALDAVAGKPLRTAVSYGLNLPQTPDAPPEMRPKPVWTGKGYVGSSVLDPVRLAAAEEMASRPGATSEALIDVADSGAGLRSDVAALGALPGRAVGGVVGAGMTVPMGALGALTEIRPLAKGETDLGTVAGNLWDLAKDNQRSFQNFGVEASMDLSNLLSFGGSTAARNGFRSTLAATGDEVLAKGVGDALKKTAGTADQVPFVLAEFEKAGKTAADAEAIFGPGLRHLGQGQLEVGIPWTQISTPIDSQYSFRKFMGQFEPARTAIDRTADVIGANRVYDRVPEFTHAARRKATSLEAAERDALAREVTDGLRALPAAIRKAWTDKDFRREFYERAIRPDFERTLPGDVAPNIPGRAQVQVPDADGNMHTLTAAEDYVPRDQLDATFGQGAAQLFDLIRGTHEKARQRLVAAGHMSEAQAAADPFSGVYMRRPVQSTGGLFDEVVVAGKEGDSSRGANALRKSRVGAAEGFPGGLAPSEMGRTPREMGRTEPPPGQAESWLDEPFMREAETDPAKLWADYVRLYGRAAAETVLRQEVARDFGSAVRPGDASVKNLGIDTKTIQMPAYSPGASEAREFAFAPSVSNILDNAFAPSSGRTSRFVRRMIPGTGPLGRGAIRLAEGYDAANNIFKSNVLKSGAYPIGNYVNDTMRDVLEGNPLPFVEQSIAAKMMRGEDGPLQLGELNTTLAEELRTLQAAGLPLDLAASHRFDLDPGTGLARDFIRAGEDPNLAMDVWRFFAPEELGTKWGGTPHMRRFGEKNETMQKTASALFWRSRGASPAEAVARAMSSKIDYQWRQPWEQVAAVGIPFAKFATEAPRRTIRTMLRQPGRIAALDDFYNAFDRNEDIEPRDTIQEAKFMRLAGTHADLARNVLREGAAFTGAVPWHLLLGQPPPDDRGPPVGMAPGYSPILTVKDDTFESFKPLQSPQAFASMLAPLFRFGVEALAEKNLATRRDVEAPDLLSLAPYGSSIFPDWATAHADQNPWATTYLPNYVPVLGARGFQLLGNIGLGMNNPYGPLTTFGGSRDYAPELDRRSAYAHQLFNFMFPGSLYAEDPASALRDLDERSGAKQALGDAKDAEETFKAILQRRPR